MHGRGLNMQRQKMVNPYLRPSRIGIGGESGVWSDADSQLADLETLEIKINLD